MRFPSGVVASLVCGFDAAFRAEMTFSGTEGHLHVPGAFQPGREALIRLERAGRVEELPVEGFEPLFLGEVEDLERVILDGAEPEIPLSETRATIETLQALRSAAGL